MTSSSPSRHGDGLSRARIVAACVAILDTEGEEGLTVRAVTARLKTGRGAIYHHIATRDEMLSEAADVVVQRALSPGSEDANHGPIGALAEDVFDAITTHPWIAPQLVRDPLQPAVLALWTAIGRSLSELGLTGLRRSDAGAALVNYLLGASAQYAAGARRVGSSSERALFLERAADAWVRADPGPLVQEAADDLRDHDDRRQFLAGLELLLAGIRAKHDQ